MSPKDGREKQGSKARILLAFDVYGSLFDTNGPHLHNAFTRLLGEQQRDLALKLVDDWRTYQLEYSWRLNSMGQFVDFGEVTRMSLLHAFKANDAADHLKEGDLEGLLNSYTNLDCFDDAIKGLEELGNMEDVDAVVFSNGPRSVVEKLLEGSPLPLFLKEKKPVVAESVKSFKPSIAFYDYLLDTTGRSAAAKTCWLVSCNPFDITGARVAGINAIWIDRTGRGWMDQLGEPTRIIGSLEELPALVSKIHDSYT